MAEATVTAATDLQAEAATQGLSAAVLPIHLGEAAPVPLEAEGILPAGIIPTYTSMQEDLAATIIIMVHTAMDMVMGAIPLQK